MSFGDCIQPSEQGGPALLGSRTRVKLSRRPQRGPPTPPITEKTIFFLYEGCFVKSLSLPHGQPFTLCKLYIGAPAPSDQPICNIHLTRMLTGELLPKGPLGDALDLADGETILVEIRPSYYF